MAETEQDRNKAIVLEAFDTLFSKRDYGAAEKYWSPDYIQHSAHIKPGREGLFSLIKSLPAELCHEVDLVMAEGDMVIVRGRFTGHGLPAPGLRLTSSALRTGSSRNTGTLSRTRFHAWRPSAVFRCTATCFPRTADPSASVYFVTGCPTAVRDVRPS
jgi:SnoaL-like protein